MNIINFLKIKNLLPTSKLISDDVFNVHDDINSRFFICNREGRVSETLTVPKCNLEKIFLNFSKKLPDSMKCIPSSFLHLDVNSIINDDVHDFRFYIDFFDPILKYNLKFFKDNFPLTNQEIVNPQQEITLIGFLINKTNNQLTYKYYITDHNTNTLKVVRFNSEKKFLNEFIEILDPVSTQNVEFFGQFNIVNNELITMLTQKVNIQLVSRLETTRKYLVIF